MIIAKRTVVEVKNYFWNDCPPLQYLFSIFDPIEHSYYYRAMEYEEDTNTLYLPRGMDISKIERYMKTNIVVDKSYDEYDKIGPILIKSLPRNDVQKKSIKFILGLQEFSYTKGFSQLCLNLVTGKGKTYVTIASIAYLEIRFIVIAPISSWLAQWKEKALQYTNFKEDEIVKLSGTIIDKILDGRIDYRKIKMYISTHTTLQNYGKTRGWDKLHEFFKVARIGIKVFDEAHLCFESVSLIDFHTNVYKTLYVTASPSRSNERENKIYQMYFERVPSIELFDRKVDARVTYLSIHFNSHPTPLILMQCRNRFKLDKVKYIDWLMQNEWYWMMMYCVFCEAVLPAKGRILILVEFNRCIEIWKNWIETYFPEYIGKIGTFHGETSDREREIAKQQKIIISNRACAGTAMDIENANITLMAAVPIKSRVISQQTFGRVGREGTTLPNMLYIDIVDMGFKVLKEYYAYRYPVYEKYANECRSYIYNDMKLKTDYDRYYKARNPVLVKPPWHIDLNLLKPKLIDPPYSIKL